MRSILGKLAIHPVTLTLLNFALMVLAYSALKTTWFDSENGLHHIHTAIELWEGYGTIVLGFGIVLEERKALKKIFRITPESDAIDQTAHDYGVIFVMLGLIIEILAWLVKMPNEVLDTENIEMIFLQSAAITACFVVILQVRFLSHVLKK